VRRAGYSLHFPFLKHPAFSDLANMEQFSLYKYMFCPDLEHQTLAIIGCFVGSGPDAPVAEMQSRLAAMVFKVRHSMRL